MFGKKDSRSEKKNPASSESASPSPAKLKHPRPKILLIDITDESASVLKAGGYNVVSGSFGNPYEVTKNDSYQPVVSESALPNFTEQEIVIIDLAPVTVMSGPPGEKETSPGENDWWAKCSRGVIDPRPLAMSYAKKASDRILMHGGVFIIFAEQRAQQEFVWGHITYKELTKKNTLLCDNWSFLSIFESDKIEFKADHGYEITATAKKSILMNTIAEHLNPAEFACTLNPFAYELRSFWEPLAANKYGVPVAGVIAPDGKQRQGWVFLLPRLSDRTHFLVKFISEVLPTYSPHLFPHLEGAKWIYWPEYELPAVLDLKHRIHQVQEEAKQKVLGLEQAIEEKRCELGFLHDLIRETDKSLVTAVKKTLEFLGCQSVKDVDEEMEKAGDTRPKSEDLQIHETSPILLIEVKGITSLPSDAEALQVWKYLAPRMKEWKRTDLQGLSIINHQRNLPALDRQNKEPFRREILDNAQEHGFGLLTTWDLYRLTRSYLTNRWKPEHVKSLFYETGRIDPVPKHYEFVGLVEHFWEEVGVLSVPIEASGLKPGDRIAYELPSEFKEQDIESLEAEKKKIAQAGIGVTVGIKTVLTKHEAKKGVRVFKLKDRS